MEVADVRVRQKRMSVKLAEWLDQYNEVSQRQQDYLHKIQQLRKSLQSKNDNNASLIMNIERVRNSDRFKNRQKRVPVAGMTRMEEANVNRGPEPFPNRPCLIHDRQIGNGFKLAPNVTPRRLAPIVNKKVKIQAAQGRQPEDDHEQQSRPDMGGAKMRTEYESFESIAKRNKLNLTQFFQPNPSLQRTPRQANKRTPMPVSTVTVMDAVPEEGKGQPNTSTEHPG